MTTTTSIKIAAEPVRSLAFGSVGGAYMGIGSGFSNPSRLLFIQNLTDALLMFSFDGINDHFPLNANAFLLLDIATNRSQSAGLYFPEGTRLYVKDVGAPSSGSVYVTTFYGQ